MRAASLLLASLLVVGCSSSSAPPEASVCSLTHAVFLTHLTTGKPETTLACMFDGAAPTLDAAASWCTGYDVQVVRYDYPACNRVVVRTAGFYQTKSLVYDRTTGALLSARWANDTFQGCSAGTDDTDDAAACGEQASCIVYCDDPRERVRPPASCERGGGDAGLDGG